VDIKFGRKAPGVVYPHLKLRNYLSAGLPAPPATVNWEEQKIGLAQPLGNVHLGDCTCAAAGHILDVFNAQAKNGLPRVTTPQTVAFYSASCGYVPGNPSTDNGGTLQHVLAYWKAHGFLGSDADAITGYASVNAASQSEVQTAVWLFGNAYVGVNLPDAWVNPMPSASGFVWNVAGAPNPQQGHCVPILGYNATCGSIDTWGLEGTITWATLAKYAIPSAGGEIYTVFSQNWINTAKGLAPSGFNAAQLSADLNAIA
jgi:hypothetical protein